VCDIQCDEALLPRGPSVWVQAVTLDDNSVSIIQDESMPNTACVTGCAEKYTLVTSEGGSVSECVISNS
jgi:hypothetical protein